MPIRIHPTADVSNRAQIGEGTTIWHQAQVRENATIGADCIIGKGVYVDAGVTIGDRVKIQNYVSVYHGVTLEDGVFVGPHVCFTNDLRPRAINPDGSLKSEVDWILSETRVRKGAALGANATIRSGIEIGEWSMVGAGSIVTQTVPDFGLVWGNPARLHGFVCPCGEQLKVKVVQDQMVLSMCVKCGRQVQIPSATWERVR